MRLVHTFIIPSLLAGSRASAFTILGLPAQVTTSQTATITWSRSLNDPTSFALGKTAASRELNVIGMASASDTETLGTMVVAFQARNPISIVAYDLDQVPYTILGILQDNLRLRPTPFFDDKRPISPAFDSMGTVLPPSTMPTPGSNTGSVLPTATTAVNYEVGPSTERRLDSGSIAAIVLGILFAVSLFLVGLSFWMFKRKGTVAGSTETKHSREFADEAQLSYPNITPRLVAGQRIGSPSIENFERDTRIFPSGTRTQAIFSPVAAKQSSGTVTNLLSSTSRGAPRNRVFHHTDSGLRLGVDNVLGNRSLVEVPPTYSEAGHRRESM
ncbi:hypothetical protein PQX77_000901 [Marasmius sp. AFHP31]|nr:hypothetical protein PQX77_000901 [Marasmius sp. AFHP31]